VRTPHASTRNRPQPLHHQPAGARSTSRATTYNPHGCQEPSSLEQWAVGSIGLEPHARARTRGCQIWIRHAQCRRRRLRCTGRMQRHCQPSPAVPGSACAAPSHAALEVTLPASYPSRRTSAIATSTRKTATKPPCHQRNGRTAAPYACVGPSSTAAARATTIVRGGEGPPPPATQDRIRPAMPDKGDTTRKTPIAVRITIGATHIWYADAIYRWRTTFWVRR
jgi:hypothetical protein